MPTREELLKMREDNLRPAKERAAKKAEKQLEEYEKKQSHNWLQTWNRTRNSAQPMLSHCLDCGVNYFLFKARPDFCPNSNKQS